MTNYLLNERLKAQRAEFEKKLDELRMKNNKNAIVLSPRPTEFNV